MARANLFHAFDLSASGLSAQRARLNVISANLANAQTTRTEGGGPYRRRVLTVSESGGPPGLSLFERMLHVQRAMELDPAKTSARHLDEPGPVRLPGGGEAVRFSVSEDDAPGRLVYEPGHPDANEEGYVEYPNVDVIREMVDLMAASRAYEANITVLNATKSMLRKALEI
jgi:flagellar basal-body rod protein FlgC